MGAIINGVLIVVAVFIGQIIGKFLKESVCQQLYKAMGLVVIYIGISSMLQMESTLNLLISMSIGTFIGGSIDLEQKIVYLGNKLQEKLSPTNEIASGFINSTLLFCVGSMAIVGAFNDGLSNDHTILIIKGIIDAIAAIVFTIQYGKGVYLSAILVVIYEGTLTLLASLLCPILSDYAIAQLSSVGGLVLLATGLKMSGIGNFKVMNMVPAIFASAIVAVLFNF